MMENNKSTNTNRRNFLQKTSLASIGVLGLGQIQAQYFSSENKPTQGLPKDLKILFQGDSITDAGRSRSGYFANHTWGGMGTGLQI